MKKNKLLAIVMAVMLAFSLAACGGEGGNTESEEKVDTSKIQISISHYNGGVGNAWFAPLKQRFEAAYANYELDGKKGVQLILYDHKDEGKSEINSIASSKKDIFISEAFDYYEGINKGLFLDISDVVTSQNTDGKTIESKMSAEQKKYFNYNGKYYALPHYAYYGGLTYNVDLFESKKLYYAANGGFIESLQDEKSAGPDGVKGTYDDGLPATYDEFFALCDEMVERDIIPFTWSGEYGKAYFRSLLARLMANYEGAEEMLINFTFDGTATHLVDNITNGNVTFKAPTEISLANGKEIYDTAGRYYALKFVERIINNKDYYDFANTGNSTDSHTAAQTRYILSSYDNNQKPIAFFVDGTYWENEAYDVGAFTALENIYDKGREDVRFAYMPLPKLDATHIGDREVIIENGGSIAYINADVTTRCPEKVELLKELLKFMNTDESLVEFVTKTNSFKAFNYSLTDAQVNKLSYYTKTVLDVRKNSDVVFPYDSNAKFANNRSKLAINETFRTNTYEWVINAFENGAVSAETFFGDLSSYMKKQWGN